MKTLRTTLLGGILFLIPLIVLTLILSKARDIGREIASPLIEHFDVERIAGVALADVLAVLLLLILCYLAGLVARGKLLGGVTGRVDDVLIDVVPGYAVLKGKVDGLIGVEGSHAIMQPVLVQFDDYSQIAFEVETIGERSVIFLPDAPASGTGTSIIVARERITRLDLPPHRVSGVLRVLGRGTGKLLPPAPDSE